MLPGRIGMRAVSGLLHAALVYSLQGTPLLGGKTVRNKQRGNQWRCIVVLLIQGRVLDAQSSMLGVSETVL
jgi:hypothetical protein